MNFLNLMVSGVVALSLVACGGNTEATDASEADAAMEEMNEAEPMASDINLESSSVEWAGTMVGVYTHTGTLNFTAGNLETNGNNVTGGSFTVDMASMTPTDDNYDPSKESTPEKLVGHLSSPDFFDVATYPTASYEITGSSENSIMGNLTLRGKTNSETVENVSYDAANNSWTGTMTVDRRKYDVSWDSEMKEMVLSDDIELTITLVL
ncbi:MAG: YceI family protein [Vicingaceae bacterium]